MKYDFSSTQLNLPDELAGALRDFAGSIPEEDLADDGREATPHVTVKYGLHGEDPEEVRALLTGESPVTVRLGSTAIFPSSESGSGDVLHVAIDSPDLHRLNKKIADALPNTETHPEYKPHATIAYLKPGTGEKYVGDPSLAGQSATIDRVAFSSKDGTVTEIPLAGDDPLEKLKALKATQQGDPLERLKELKGKKRPVKIGQHGIPISDDSPEDPTYAQQALGGISAIARDVPGAEAAQAMVRSLLRGQTYQEALDDIRAAEDAAPTAVRVGNRLTGATVAAAAIPFKNVMAQGATYGGLSGAMKADPVSAGNRAGSATVDAAVGAVLPKVVETAGAGVRAAVAPSLGKVVQLRNALMEAEDAVNYGRAAREGNISATQPLDPTITAVMKEPDIAPYIREVTTSRTMQGANPSAIIREALKLMTEREQLLSRQQITSGDFRAGSELERRDLAAAKARLLDVSRNLMPSLREAVTTHATREGERDVLNTAADATKRIVSGKSGAAKKLDTNSPEALQALIDNMTPDEAKAALQGILGRAKELPGITANPLKLFGGPRSLAKSANIVPILEQLDRVAGPAPDWYRPTNASQILAALGMGATAGR